MNSNTTTAAIPESWPDLWKIDQPIDFEAFLRSDLLAAKHNHLKAIAIIVRTSGSISVVASIGLACHILRSHDGLSTTYHRLVFGLSVADIFSSFGQALSSTMAPKEMNYLIPFARGNTATCDAQGFIIATGYFIGAIYNSSTCLYYLAIIRYNKKDEYIKNKLEPWFHGISIIVPLIICFTTFAMKGYNGNDASAPTCYADQTIPPHCIGYENGVTPEGFSTPCGRVDEKDPILLLAKFSVYFVALLVTPTVIIVTMILMHRSVAKIEKKMKNYGVNALRLAARSGGNADNTEDQGRGVMDRIKKRINCLIPTCLRRDDDQVASRSNNLTSQKRAILQMATSYVLAWGFVFIPLMFGLIMQMLFEDEFRMPEILIAIFTPLQGLFSFLAYMAPKVRNAKRSKRENLTWSQAFIKVYISRGDIRRSTRNSSLTSNARSSTTYQKLKDFVSRYSKCDTRTTALTNTRTTTQGASELPTHVASELPLSIQADRLISEGDNQDNTPNKKPRAADEEETCEEQNTYHERNKVEYNLPPNVAENK